MSDLELYKAQVISCEISIRNILDKYISSDKEKDKVMDLIADIETLSGKYAKEIIELEKYVERHNGQSGIGTSLMLLKRIKGAEC